MKPFLQNATRGCQSIFGLLQTLVRQSCRSTLSPTDMSNAFAHRHARLLRALATVLLSLTAACTTRPFQPSPPAYKLWAKPGVSEQGVRSAMLDCGFVDSAYVDGTVMTNNDYARAQLCMIDKRFVYQDRRILCADVPELPACANVARGKTFGSDPDIDPARLDRRPVRAPAYSDWSRPGTDTEGVKRAMLACGYTTVTEPIHTMLLNDIAAAELCMIDQQFRYARPASALLCKNPPGLPACRNRKIDAQQCCAPPTPAEAR